MNIEQRAALTKAVKVAEDIMEVYEREAGFDEDYECGKVVNTLIDLIDAFIDQIEVIEAKDLLSDAVDMLFLIVERYDLGDVSEESEIAFKKVKKKAEKLKAQIQAIPELKNGEEVIEVSFAITGCIAVTIPYTDIDEDLGEAWEAAKRILSKCKELDTVEYTDRVWGAITKHKATQEVI